ncbi:hypothetical protein GDO78_019379 [Eleutherodactylus coqui]|uniref:TIL domain-containing protein n=1 Tax=Eleutherodactylus coqui TaxID=57060 RepID=A0A8J6BJI0_ELECQ|nr:hypothetical protein GDO78_019379 [Eleutherodactylus coqui]
MGFLTLSVVFLVASLYCAQVSSTQTDCPPGAEWSTCTGCGDYCPVKDMSCLAVCGSGCKCGSGYKLHNNRCIPKADCPS